MKPVSVWLFSKKTKAEFAEQGQGGVSTTARNEGLVPWYGMHEISCKVSSVNLEHLGGKSSGPDSVPHMHPCTFFMVNLNVIIQSRTVQS